MENIAFIVTGQLRTFFNNDNFINMINLTKTKYKLVHCICVVNPTSNTDIERLSNYLTKNNVSCSIIDFSEYDAEFKKKCAEKCKDNRMQQMVNIYYSAPRHAHRGISNPYEYSCNSTFIQYYQLYIGLKTLRTYINNTGTDFDIVCKTRFDCIYQESFYPHVPTCDNIIESICFYNTTIMNKLHEHNITNLDDLIQFNLYNRLPLPYGHITEYHAGLSFGGMVCYNYQSLQNIKNHGLTNVLFAFNDYYYFGNKNTFFKLLNIFDDSCFYKPQNPDLYNHYFCPESQFMNYCLNNNIDIVMYPECVFGTLVNR